MSIFRVLENN